MTRAPDFAAAAASFVGTRYQHQARLPGVGLDCVGVPLCALAIVGVEIDDVAGYGRLPDGDTLTRALEAHCDRVSLVDVAIGDVVAFAWVEEPQHVAVVTSLAPYIEIVHAHSHARKVVKHILDDTWRARARVCYRIRALYEETF